MVNMALLEGLGLVFSCPWLYFTIKLIFGGGRLNVWVLHANMNLEVATSENPPKSVQDFCSRFTFNFVLLYWKFSIDLSS